MPKCLKCLPVLILLALSTGAFSQYDPNHFDPDNAAHWYQKAFALYEVPDDIELLEYAYGEVGLTPSIQQFLEEQQPVIDLITKAAAIERCDWELNRFEDPTRWVNPFIQEARRISDLLLADAYFNYSKGNISTMINRINTVFRISLHIDSGETLDHLTSVSVRLKNYAFFHNLLNYNPDTDLNNLHLINQLLQQDSLTEYEDFEDVLDFNLYQAKVFLNEPTKYLVNDSNIELMLNPAENLITDEFYKKNYTCFENYIEKVRQASQLPYPEAYERITEITDIYREKWDFLAEHFEGLPEGYKATQTDADYTQQFDYIYTLITNISPLPGTSASQSLLNIETRENTLRNALLTGISLLIEYRESKTLPDILGPDFPYDPFSGKPFLLIKNTDSFILKCQGVQKGSFLQEDSYNEYEFNLDSRPDWNKKEQEVFDPNNASHWYKKGAKLLPSVYYDPDTKEIIYQLVQNEVGQEIRDEFLDVLFDEDESNEEGSSIDLGAYIKGQSKCSQAVRNYLTEHHTAIEDYLKGASLRYCQWETEQSYSFSDDMGVMVKAMLAAVDYSNMVQAIQLIEADALAKAEEDDTQVGLDQLLAVFNIIHHHNRRAKTNLSWHYCSAFNGAYQGVLRMVPYIESRRIDLLKLQDKLESFSWELKEADRIFTNETFEMTMQIQESSSDTFGPAALEYFKQEMGKNLNIPQSGNEDKIEVLNYDQSRIRTLYRESRERLSKALDEPSFVSVPYVIEEIKTEYGSQAISIENKKIVIDINCLIPITLLESWLSSYHSYTTTKANIHACLAAVEVALIKARTGRYPDNLPDSAPLDPFSGRPFEYTLHENGFRLRSKVQDPLKKEFHEWIIAKPEKSE